MGWLKAVWTELIGLFVDDGALAVAVLIWLAAAFLVLPRLQLPAALPPILLFAGLAAILMESTVRHARRTRGGGA
jgi:hypothetical protein